MSLWRQLIHGLRVLADRRAADQDIEDEVRHYLDESVADFQARGLSPSEARRAARMEIGNATVIREQVSDYGWENGLGTLLGDLRHAARRLAGNPGFTAVAVLTLALGIGATTAIFSVLEGVLWKPLPYPHSDRLVALRHKAPGIHIDDLNLSASLYFTYSEENRAFQDVALWSAGSATITSLAEPEEVPALWVTRGFLPTLGAQPAFGRGFTALDDSPAGERTVMLSYAWWKARFGGDRAVLGRRIRVDGDAAEVIGILPPSFVFMDQRFSMLLPQRFDRGRIRLISFCCQGFARLRPRVSLQQAEADVGRMIPMAPAKFPLNPGASATGYRSARIGPNLRFLKDDLVGDIGRTLWVLLATVGIVLLIACANVANLLLVRADGRCQELAVRAALGAGWGRIARDLLLETALLGVAGGAIGLALAYAALRALAAFGPELPRIHEIAIDPAVLAFNLGLSLAAGLLFGLIPAWKYARPQLFDGLRGGGRSLTASRERHRARSILIAVQVALALVLLVGSGLMIRTFQALRRVDPGFFRPREVETFRVSIPATLVSEPEQVIRTEEALVRKLEALAGASAVGMIDALPLEGGSNHPTYAEDHPTQDGSMPPIRRFRMLSPGYARAAGARLIAGRDLTWAEIYSQAPVALVSENLAREWWRDPRAAIGKRIRTALNDDWREVIGVLENLRDNGIDQPAPAMVYWPLWQKNWAGAGGYLIRSVAFVIRTPRAGSAAFRHELELAVASVNASLAAADVKTLESVCDRSLARASFTASLLAIAGAMALLLGIVGIYGVISYSISQRHREIGIRLALGAPIGGVLRLFVRNGLAVSGVGAAFGLAAALVLTRFMRSQLFEVSPADPLTYILASSGLILAAALASYLPARTATRVDPVEVLRAE